jgi:uncharacterized Ntn-hydrolase superfamily protein
MTYSVVARDPQAGRFGVAVQSHYLASGNVVPWLAAGVGAVATQATVNVSFGPLGLELLRAGRSAAETVAALVASDADRADRQLAVVDHHGGVDAYTGTSCIPAAGHLLGESFSVQGNLLERAGCWPAMADAYRAALDLPFSERLLRSLEAGEAQGGDVRGRQSGAIVIVEGEPNAAAWQGRLLDLRVDDHPDPLVELRRLVDLAESYALVSDEAGSERSAEDRYAEARARAPDAYELVFWRGLELAQTGDREAGRRELQIAFRAEPRWRTTLEHLVDGGQVERELGTRLLEELR